MEDFRLAPVHEAVAALMAQDLDPSELARRRATLLERSGLPAGARAAGPAPAAVLTGKTDPAVRAAALLRPLDRAAFDHLRLGKALTGLGLDDDAVARTRIALELGHPSEVRDPARLAAAWLADPDVRAFLGVHEWEGNEWFKKEAFESLLALASGLDLADGASRTSPAIATLRRAGADAGYRVDRFLAALEAPSTARSRRSGSRSS